MCTKYIWIRIRKHIVENPWSFSLLLPKSNDAESSTYKHALCKKTSLKKKNTNNLKKPTHFLKTEVLINVILTDNLYHKDLPFSWSTQLSYLISWLQNHWISVFSSYLSLPIVHSYYSAYNPSSKSGDTQNQSLHFYKTSYCLFNRLTKFKLNSTSLKEVIRKTENCYWRNVWLIGPLY